MQNKLQELTDRLYAEGLSKGKQEGEEVLKNAKAEAEQIVSQAKAEAERIIAEANKKADELKTKTEADIRMAGAQSIAAVRHEVEQLILAQAVEKSVKGALSADEFLKEMIKTVVAAFNPGNSAATELELILPEAVKSSVEPFLKGEVSRQLNAGIEVSYSKKLNAGFKISPKGSGYLLQFTDDEFIRLISSYLRPAAKKILFG